MEILNQQILHYIKQKTPIRIDMGSGGKSTKGYALDLLPLEGIDIVADLNQPLSLLPDDSVEYIFTRHTLEHVDNFMGLMHEIHRITLGTGTIEIIVPHFSNPYFYSDPTHKRFFGLYSFFYFVKEEDQPPFRKVPCFYSEVRFRIHSIKIAFYRTTWIDKLLAPILERLINRSTKRQDFFERRIANLFHAWQITYVISPLKNNE